MNLIRLIYASRFCESKFDSMELAKINKSAQKHNKVSEITGCLVLGEEYFLQCLEGDREAVSKTFNRISLDPRHESIILLVVEDITRRDFADWEMKFVVLTEANEKLIREFSASSLFNPFTMHWKNALELLKAIRKIE